MSFLHKHGGLLTTLVLFGTFGALITGAYNIFQDSELQEAFRPVAVAGTDESSPKKLQRLTVLGDTFTGYSTFRSEAFQADLLELGIELTYENEFSQFERAQKLTQNEADLTVTTLDQFLQQQPAGKIVGLIDRTTGADAIVLNSKQYPRLQSLKALQQHVAASKTNGRKPSIAFAADTPSEYLALVLDTNFEAFNLEDFELKPVADASDVWNLMQDPGEKIAIGVLWEPFVTQAREQGNKVVLSSKDAPKAIIDVIVASERLLQHHPDLVDDFLEAYYRRIDNYVKDPAKFESQIIADSDLTAEQVAAVINGIDFFTAPEALSWLTQKTITERIDSTAAILALDGRLARVPDNAKSLIAVDHLQEAAKNTRAIAELVHQNNPNLSKRLLGEGHTIPARAQPTPQVTHEDIGSLKVQGKIVFEVGTAKLTPEGEAVLNQFAQQVKDFNVGTTAIKIIGHTSSTGSAQRNLQLSQQRAIVVGKYLSDYGVKHKLTTEGKGSSQPLPEITPEDSRNQRTEIRLIRIGR